MDKRVAAGVLPSVATVGASGAACAKAVNTLVDRHQLTMARGTRRTPGTAARGKIRAKRFRSLDAHISRWYPPEAGMSHCATQVLPASSSGRERALLPVGM